MQYYVVIVFFNLVSSFRPPTCISASFSLNNIPLHIVVYLFICMQQFLLLATVNNVDVSICMQLPS